MGLYAAIWIYSTCSPETVYFFGIWCTFPSSQSSLSLHFMTSQRYYGIAELHLMFPTPVPPALWLACLSLTPSPLFLFMCLLHGLHCSSHFTPIGCHGDLFHGFILSFSSISLLSISLPFPNSVSTNFLIKLTFWMNLSIIEKDQFVI